MKKSWMTDSEQKRQQYFTMVIVELCVLVAFTSVTQVEGLYQSRGQVEGLMATSRVLRSIVEEITSGSDSDSGLTQG